MVVRIPKTIFSAKNLTTFLVDRLFVALFFLFLVLPVSEDLLKAILIATLLFLMLLEALLGRREIHLHKSIVGLTVFYALLGLLFVAIGVINNAPGAVFSALIYVVWPMVYIVFVGRFSSPKYLLNLQRLLVIGAIAIGLVIINQLLFSLGVLPESLRIVITQYQDIVFYEGYTQMRLYAISTLVYLAPYFIAALMIGRNSNNRFVARKWLWLALFFSIFGIFMSGRRAGLLNIVFAVPITLLLISFQPKGRKLRITRRGIAAFGFLAILSGLILAVMTNVLGWRLDEQILFVLSSFDSSVEFVRFDQLNALLSGWLQSPIWGWGLGSYTEVVIRNDARPWMYELQYAQLLFQMGFVGFLAYTAGVVWLCVKGIEMMRMDKILGSHVAPVLVGCICFLFANATNPYLQAYGHLWTLFVVVAFVNTWMLSKRVSVGYS